MQSFLDVTKANLFFARGLMIVEGDAENILIPSIARLLGRDFTENGVSIVNVGGIGLHRYARIFQRHNPEKDGIIKIPVACVTDFDVMPDCAPKIIGRVRPGEDWPGKKERHWRAKSDYSTEESNARRKEICSKASGQNVKTFVANEWTFEYDLAFHGLAKDVWIAAHLAKADEKISTGKTSKEVVVCNATRSFEALSGKNLNIEELASHIYAIFASGSASKATAAQYLAYILEERFTNQPITEFRGKLPPYLVDAIEYVTPNADSNKEVAADD
jgi:putative ATP-dependent endonuclease of OLD family